MVLGLDGKLYFTQGDGCCSVQKDKPRGSRTSTWSTSAAGTSATTSSPTPCGSTATARSSRSSADRQRNNYETSLNSFGNIFTSDNDDDGNRGCRVIWVMDGGHYGYHTPGSPRHWGEEVPATCPSSSAPATAAPAGIMVYEGDLLPKEYHGSVLEADAGTRQINFFPLTRNGASLPHRLQGVPRERRPLVPSHRRAPRPTARSSWPTGTTRGVGGHAFRDQTTGRIYRVAPKGTEAQAAKVRFRAASTA